MIDFDAQFDDPNWEHKHRARRAQEAGADFAELADYFRRAGMFHLACIHQRWAASAHAQARDYLNRIR